jgi:AcrR family transcriptional regulator
MTTANTARDAPEAHAERQRERVLRAAARLVPRLGVEGVRLRDVADEAGVSIGLLQHYFRTRDELVRETCRWGSRERVRSWTSAADPGRDPWERFVALVEHFFADPAFEDQARIWMEFCGDGTRDPELKTSMGEIYDAWRGPVRDLIQEGTDSGRFTPRAPVADVVDALMMLMDGSQTAYAVGASGMTVDRMRRIVLEVAAAELAVDL